MSLRPFPRTLRCSAAPSHWRNDRSFASSEAFLCCRTRLRVTCSRVANWATRIDALAGSAVRGTRGAWGVLTLDLIDRRDSFRSAILAALAPFYNTALYQG